MCPVVMRARGVLLIKDAAYLKQDYDRQSEDHSPFFLKRRPHVRFNRRPKQRVV